MEYAKINRWNQKQNGALKFNVSFILLFTQLFSIVQTLTYTLAMWVLTNLWLQAVEMSHHRKLAQSLQGKEWVSDWAVRHSLSACSVCTRYCANQRAQWEMVVLYWRSLSYFWKFIHKHSIIPLRCACTIHPNPQENRTSTIQTTETLPWKTHVYMFYLPSEFDMLPYSISAEMFLYHQLWCVCCLNLWCHLGTRTWNCCAFRFESTSPLVKQLLFLFLLFFQVLN